MTINKYLLEGKFQEWKEFIEAKGAHFLLKNTHDLKSQELELETELESEENIEEETIKKYSEKNPSDFNKLIPSLMQALSTEKQEGETNEVFTTRIFEDAKNIFGL